MAWIREEGTRLIKAVEVGKMQEGREAGGRFEEPCEKRPAWGQHGGPSVTPKSPGRTMVPRSPAGEPGGKGDQLEDFVG